MNQWNSVVRWELRTKLFLRTLEFYWQEGHTAHATREEAEAETAPDAGYLCGFCDKRRRNSGENPREKSDAEKFAGADVTYSIEAMMATASAAIRHVSFSGTEFRASLRGQIPRPERPAAALLDDIVGTLHTRHWRHH